MEFGELLRSQVEEPGQDRGQGLVGRGDLPKPQGQRGNSPGAELGQGTGAPLKRQEEDVEPGRKQSRERATEVIGPNQGRSQKRKE